MSEDRLCPNIPTDSKTTFEIFKTQKLPHKIQKPEISFKSQNIRKLTPPNMPILITKQHSEGPKGPPRWPKATSPSQKVEGGLRSGPNFSI